MKYFDYGKEFKRFRKFYRLFGEIFKSWYWIVKLYFRRHDTLASDHNINPDKWNRNLMILRNSYSEAFEVWSKWYLWDDEKHGKKGIDRDGLYDLMYHQLSQRSFRFLIDFLSTLYVEDTVYRELLNFWMFELQFQMNRLHNPDKENIHVVYSSYLDGDPQYIRSWKIAERMMMEDAAKRANTEKFTKAGKYKQAIGSAQQDFYVRKKIQKQYEEKKRQLAELEKIMEGMQ